ncbi:unnamed protein product [Trichogramma brassicae]|uniref:Uncharacterized protein n=1 Tax=Trichogramma brassicae TaxID=86971 RepID=A0A6H5I1I9_9HYME|nr:unnamed protein product [Trichogramma brassicae]
MNEFKRCTRVGGLEKSQISRTFFFPMWYFPMCMRPWAMRTTNSDGTADWRSRRPSLGAESRRSGRCSVPPPPPTRPMAKEWAFFERDARIGVVGCNLFEPRRGMPGFGIRQKIYALKKQPFATERENDFLSAALSVHTDPERRRRWSDTYKWSSWAWDHRKTCASSRAFWRRALVNLHRLRADAQQLPGRRSTSPVLRTSKPEASSGPAVCRARRAPRGPPTWPRCRPATHVQHAQSPEAEICASIN